MVLARRDNYVVRDSSQLASFVHMLKYPAKAFPRKLFRRQPHNALGIAYASYIISSMHVGKSFNTHVDMSVMPLPIMTLTLRPVLLS